MNRSFLSDNKYGIEWTEDDLWQKEKINQIPEKKKHGSLLKWDSDFQFNMQGMSGKTVLLLGKEFTKWNISKSGQLEKGCISLL